MASSWSFVNSSQATVGISLLLLRLRSWSRPVAMTTTFSSWLIFEPLGSLRHRRRHPRRRGFRPERCPSSWRRPTGAGQFDTVLVGFGSEFERFPRTTSLPYTDQIVDDLYHRSRRGRNMLQRAGLNSYAEARCGGAGASGSHSSSSAGPPYPEEPSSTSSRSLPIRHAGQLSWP